jgi:serine/threonine-protein kinase HipA
MSDRAYVFGHLPGATAQALLGQVIVEETGDAGFCRFKYAASWLKHPRAFALDPDLLPLDAREFASQPGWEVFGALRDAGPDYWGRKVIERRLGRVGLTELEFLLAAGDQRAGALGFSTEREPSGTVASAPSVHRLPDLLDAAASLERDEPIAPELLELLGEGSGTLGGMRPKATVERDGELWVAKLPAKDDRHAVTRWEHATLALAARCGIRVPPHELLEVGGRAVLLTQRFDRRRRGKGQLRAHLLSGLTMLGSHERDHGQGSYAALASWLRRHGGDGTRARKEIQELFLRMVFNVIVGNTDDHLRNHVVVDFGDGFHLSPAFDLVPLPAVGGVRRQAIGVGELGRDATIDNALTHAGHFGLDDAEAETLVSKLRATIAKTWQKAFKASGVKGTELEAIERLILTGLGESARS